MSSSAGLDVSLEVRLCDCFCVCGGKGGGGGGGVGAYWFMGLPLGHFRGGGLDVCPLDKALEITGVFSVFCVFLF